MTDKEKQSLYNQHGFPIQKQEEPGLQSKMMPIPDDGATSYHGHERLKHKKALITGGDSDIGRAGQPAEIAGAYVFLASDEASFITGESLSVNGGLK